MVGEAISNYHLIGKIGNGGMGEVYRARDDRLDRDVALKILPAGALTEDSQKRFRQEAVLLAKLNHPKIATIHEFSSHSSVDILVMELIPGRSLREILRRKLMMLLCASLQSSHSKPAASESRCSEGSLRYRPLRSPSQCLSPA